MRITHLRLANWRNFRSADLSLRDRVFIVGPNASGKSNLLDAIRFLRDVASSGFGRAVHSRGGLTRVRCLAARNYNRGHVTLAVGIGDDDHPEMWRYELTFKSEGRGQRRPIIQKEQVIANGEVILERPDERDLNDPELLIQTHLEQVTANKEFRDIAGFLASVRYLHLVPQFVRQPERVATVDNDPFGTDFLIQLAKTNNRTRDKRLKTINKSLQIAVPQLDRLELIQDEIGKWHLQGRYDHWRPHPAFQDERDFSDGTLRLIGLLWALQEKKGPVLLEEPELSLHTEVVRWIPPLVFSAQRESKSQVILTTHSPEMLGEEGIDPGEVVLLQPGPDGTIATTADLNDQVNKVVKMGLPIRDAIIPLSQPKDSHRVATEFAS